MKGQTFVLLALLMAGLVFSVYYAEVIEGAVALEAYQNAKGGFKLMAPKGWKINEAENNVFWNGPEMVKECYPAVQVSWLSAPMDSKTYIAQMKKSFAAQEECTDVADCAVKGGVGFRYKETDKGAENEPHGWFLVAHGNGKLYTCKFQAAFGSFGEYGPIFERIIGSFEIVK